MASSQRSGPIVSINVTPFVDVVLVLLIIFMATSAYIVAPAVELELPKASVGQDVAITPLSLILGRDGKIYLDEIEATEGEVARRCRRVSAGNPEAQAIIAADGSAPHRDVVHLIDIVKRNGIERFALNVDPQAHLGE